MLKELPSLLPRPLRILLIVVIVLGIVSCGIGFARGRIDSEPSTSPTPTFKPIDLGLRRVLGDAIDTEPFGSGDCSPALVDSAVVISVTSGLLGGGCQLSVQPDAFRPRELVLRVGGGAANVRVEQTVQGRSGSSEEKSVSAGEAIEMTVAGSDELRIYVSCGCTLTVEP
jgi:hypothetical protein